jgi:hypothetical protein
MVTTLTSAADAVLEQPFNCGAGCTGRPASQGGEKEPVSAALILLPVKAGAALLCAVVEGSASIRILIRR